MSDAVQRVQPEQVSGVPSHSRRNVQRVRRQESTRYRVQLLEVGAHDDINASENSVFAPPPLLVGVFDSHGASNDVFELAQKLGRDHAHLRTSQSWPWPWSVRDHSTTISEGKCKGKVLVRNQSTVEVAQKEEEYDSGDENDDEEDDDYDDD